MGVVLRVQQKTVSHFLIVITITLSFFYAGIPSVQAATIIRPPNNLGLVGYWSFDEGRGTQAGDLSGGDNNGTFVGSPVWTVGKAAGGMGFDGVSSYLTVPHPTVVNSISVSFWLKVDVFDVAYQAVVAKGEGNSWRVSRLGSSNVLHFSGLNSSAVNGSVDVNDGEWHHVVAVHDSSTIALYVDGQLDASGSPGVVQNQTVGPFHIGNNPDQLSRIWEGGIDEVRIYNRALTASEIQSLYINTRSTVVGITPVDRHNNGLVGHWTFDGKHTTATIAEDAAGENDGVISGAVPTRGIIGQAMEFDGVNDNVKLASSNDLNITGDITVSSWVYLDPSFSSPASIVHKGSHYSLHIGNTRRITWADSSVWSYANFGYHGEVPLGQWTHITAIKEGSLVTVYVDAQVVISKSFGGPLSQGSSVAHIGCYAGNAGGISCSAHWLNGLTDDVRIYNRALSAAEVAGLYSATSSSKMKSSTDELVTSGLVGHWSLDASTVSGNTVQDLSGNDNSGTLVGGAVSATGKIGEAMEFNGSNGWIKKDTVSLPSGNVTATISAWVYPRSFSSQWQGIAGWGLTTTGKSALLDTNNGRLAFSTWGQVGANDVISNSYLPLNQWSFLVGVIENKNIKLYLNGLKVHEQAITSTPDVASSQLRIASTDYPGRYSDGLIDDVRIYNRALTEEEITQLYSMGQ